MSSLTTRAKGDSAHERFWRSIGEAEGCDEASDAAQPLLSFNRRDFVKLMGASLALAGTAGCSRPPLEKIVPYVHGPAQQTYGKPVYYASVLPHDGYGIGVLVETNMGRPTKIEGNPLHPASLGATDVFRQAAVLELWDPDRSRLVRNNGRIATWDELLAVLEERLRARGGGAGLRLLTGTVASPSLHDRIAAVLTRLPAARWHQWQPVNRDNVHAGAQLACGEPLDVVAHFDRAKVVLALDGDFLDDNPAFVRYAVDFATTRSALAPRAGRSRLYALECTPTLTGANADHRLPLRASHMEAAARQVAIALGVPDVAPAAAVLPPAWLDTVAADLRAHAGASIVTAGQRQPAPVHALAHAINRHLGNDGATIDPIAPVAEDAVDHLRSLRELVDAMNAGEVDTLIVSGTNAVYTAPVDVGFASALAHVAVRVHHGLYRDETAAACNWHVPATHALESWGDLRSHDGTIALQQPCIAPLYGGKSAHELFAALDGDVVSTQRDLVAGYWRTRQGAGFDAFFDNALRTGVVAESARPAKSLRTSLPFAMQRAQSTTDDDIELVFAADPRTGDGAWANNAWLQELPQPVTQLAWDNAALVSPALASRLACANEDVVELRVGDRSGSAPIWIVPGMPDGAVALTLGYGRSAAGGVGDGHGTNAYALRTSGAPWIVRGVTIVRTGRRQRLACAQTHHAMEGRDIVRMLPVDEAEACTSAQCATLPHRDSPTLYDSPATGPSAWAMSVDLSACIGCGTCTIACQAENNIPVVGRDEMRNGREMHWIRVDRYHVGPVANPRTVFQPVPCMQCEHAPCEPVCPVEASVHDAQGINVQVYNRCVGTRFCSNNCPYKVRRFNFLQYSQDVPGLDAQRNPQVTVRMRGVMEKCNYCLQRITTAKIDADREGRALRDGEVVTACQAACPTRAIAFGDLALAGSEVRQRKASPLDYALLADLNTRPRTTYLVRVINPAAGIDLQPVRTGGRSPIGR